MHVAAAGLHANCAHDGERGIAHSLIFLVGKRHDWRNGDAVAGVHAHWVDVLNAAHNDAVVFAVAHYFEFVFLPAEHALVDEHLADHAGGQTAPHGLFKLFKVVGDAATGAAERECWTQDGWQATFLEEFACLVHVGDGARKWLAEAEFLNDLPECFAIFGAMNDFAVGADHLHAVTLQDTVVPERACAVECGLSAQRWKQRIDRCAKFLLANDDFFNGLGSDRLDVGAITERGIGHDRRGIGIHQDDAEALFMERLACLRSGVVELAALADDNGARADDQDGVDVCATWHRVGPTLRPAGESGARVWVCAAAIGRVQCPNLREDSGTCICAVAAGTPWAHEARTHRIHCRNYRARHGPHGDCVVVCSGSGGGGGVHRDRGCRPGSDRLHRARAGWRSIGVERNDGCDRGAAATAVTVHSSHQVGGIRSIQGAGRWIRDCCKSR